ncbi:unnamed protein product [Mytilus coruscus]|uniref:DZIP3-like HEPN domain-containing protein n=1 Tax=Mytilus coruscus TaxID=42192 RepID=A0A6J8B814_MYTCO|nr:unnamed protein product [Mytilus coruscus]
MFNGEWSNQKSKEKSSSEEASESNPQTSKNQTCFTKVRLSVQGGMKTVLNVSEESTKGGTLTGFTKEEINFAKMGMIILNILADVLFDLLKQDNLNLRSRSDCDISYLYREHRNLNKHIPSNSRNRRCPPGPWGGTWLDIQVTDIAIGDDIERIRLTRNELQHSKTFLLDDIRCNELYTIIADLLKRFNQHNKPGRLYTDHLNEIRAKTISADEMKVLQHQIKNEIELGKLAFLLDKFPGNRN